jgi:hypothetical protein
MTPSSQELESPGNPGRFSFTYRQVQSMTGHKDIRMVVRYDHERGNLEENAINFLHYGETGDQRRK